MKLPKLALLAAALVSVSSLQLAAQSQPAPAATASSTQAEVSNVKFRYDRNWLETEIELNIKPAVGDFIDRTRVTLSLAVEAMPLGATDKKQHFYKATAELVAIEKTKATVRFYLPPEIVKRDRLRGDPLYLVELDVAGEAQKPSILAISKAIPVASTFRSKVSSESALNDGVLLPQYLTPYANLPAPSFIRREPQR